MSKEKHKTQLKMYMELDGIDTGYIIYTSKSESDQTKLTDFYWK